jgi:hypothetical protein
MYHVVYKMELMLHVDRRSPQIVNVDLVRLKNKTFDCAETEVGDGDTASRGIS